MRVHLIAIGGAAMHNIALALHRNGHTVSGSDDEIYNPARDRLAAAGLLPDRDGWRPETLDSGIDVVILGMHARADNPELLRAQELGLKVLSYPAFMYEHARNKIRMVVAGSHGKTTTTAMTMHVLRKSGIDFDYLVGAQLDGFDTMVRLSDAPVLVVEGDEYLSSCLEPVSKMVQYRPHHAVITGIAWDHINVFPEFETYCAQFGVFMDHIEPGGNLFYYESDPEIKKLVAARAQTKQFSDHPFEGFNAEVKDGRTWLHVEGQEPIAVDFFGAHNLLNARAAFCLCRELGISETDFVRRIADFKGAAKRLQVLKQTADSITWLDFAHAPSKARATVEAVKTLYPDRRLTACLELHTFSSLNKAFLPEYRHTLNLADQALVFYSPHTLEMKRMPPVSAEEIQAAFDHPDLQVVTDAAALKAALAARTWSGRNLLLMSSGTFGGADFLKDLAG